MTVAVSAADEILDKAYTLNRKPGIVHCYLTVFDNSAPMRIAENLLYIGIEQFLPEEDARISR